MLKEQIEELGNKMNSNPNEFDLIKQIINSSINPKPFLFRNEIEGIIISTVDTDDCGLETAIIDKNDAYPVERYPDLKSAETGHKKWAEFISLGNRKVTKLGYGSIVPPLEVEIRGNDVQN